MTKSVFRGYRATDKPRCKSCQIFLPETTGHNRELCASCGTPNTWYVKND